MKKKTTPPLKLINLKMTEDEFKVLKARARRYTGGNLSLWLRLAGSTFIPRKKDLV